MLMILCNPLRHWWQTAFKAAAPVAALALPSWRPLPRTAISTKLPQARPLTPFRAPVRRNGSVEGARRAARRFWMTLDPDDQRRAAIGGSFAEVCAALEKLAAVEERRA